MNKRLQTLIHEVKITKAKECIIRHEELREYHARPDDAPPPRRFPSVHELLELTADLFPRAPAGSRSRLAPTSHAAVMEESPPVAFNLKFEEYTEVLRKCPKASSEGVDGWTFAHIVRSLQCERLQHECFEAIKALTELAYSNRLPGWFVMCETRVVFIPKDKEWTRYRPLGIASAWYRLIAKFLHHRFDGPTGQKLGGIQLALGRPDGCSIGAKVLQHLYDQHFYIQASDSPNAFNREDHNRIYVGLQRYCPELLNFFVWGYGGEADLRTGTGLRLGKIFTGVRQGDPLAMLLFCVSVQARLLHMKAMLDRFDEEDGVDGANRSRIIAYADDFFPAIKCAGNRSIDDVRRRFIEINSFCYNDGVPLNMDKTRIIHHPDLPSFSRRPDEEGHSPFEAQCQTSGIMLGAMISSDLEDIKRTVEETRAEIQRLCSMVSKDYYDLQARYLVLAYCINAYPTYMARIYNPSIVSEGMEAIDTCIDQTLGNMLQGNPSIPAHALTLRSLPQRLGGLGLTRFMSSFSCIQFDVLNMRAEAFITEFLPDLLPTFKDSIPLVPPDMLGEGEILVSNARSRYQAIQKKKYDELLTQLIADPLMKPVATSIKSQSFRGSGAAISISGGGIVRYKASVLQRVLCSRLAMSCKPNHINWTCPCRNGPYLKNLACDPTNTTHYLCCPSNQGFRNTRHNSVVKHLTAYLKTVVPEATVTEKPVFFPGDLDRRIEGDLLVTINRPEGATSYTIDVGITSMSSIKYISEMDPLHLDRPTILNDPHRAATDYENLKIQKYAGSGAPNLVPFIITDPGNVGHKAALFLDAVEGKRPPDPDEPPDPDRMVILHSARHQLLSSIVHTCQKAAACARQITEKSLVQDQHPPPIGNEDDDILNEFGVG